MLHWGVHEFLVANDLEPNHIDVLLVLLNNFVQIGHYLEATFVFCSRAVWAESDVQINGIINLQMHERV
jgi:hypothetical protein